jgi:hypothetical protein
MAMPRPSRHETKDVHAGSTGCAEAAIRGLAVAHVGGEDSGVSVKDRRPTVEERTRNEAISLRRDPARGCAVHYGLVPWAASYTRA